VRYDAGRVSVAGINERVLEVPYVHAAVAALAPASRLLDVGGAESTLSLSLASLGFQVTLLDLRRAVLAHPNLESVQSPLETWAAPESSFDGVICLSSIEHFGLGAYGEPPRDDDTDLAAMRRLWSLAKPNALLAFTAPFGRFEIGTTQRTYDLPALDRLLQGWDVTDLRFGVQASDGSWCMRGGREHGAEIVQSGRPAVALVTARRKAAAPVSR
jgi:hypothetical protein